MPWKSLKFHVRLSFMVYIISPWYKREMSPLLLAYSPPLPYFPFIVSPPSRDMDFLDALPFDDTFSKPAPFISQFTDPRHQFPFIPANQAPNVSFVRTAHWPSLKSSSPLQGTPGPSNTVPDFPVHQGTRTTQAPFQRLLSYGLTPSLLLTHHPYEAVVPHSQLISPSRVDFDPVPKAKRRPPRPSNAFMLFRSDFLKRNFVRDQETRQHRLSIIAGKCWHRLSKDEKNKWFSEAEREKKRHALKYAGYRFQPRRRTKIRREPKPASPPEDFESLCRLADMAYEEIINDDLARENTTPPSPTSTSVSPSPTITTPPTQIDTAELPFLEGYGEQVVQRPFSTPAGEADPFVRSAQLPYLTIDPIRDSDIMSCGVGHFRRPPRASYSDLFCCRFVTFHPLVKEPKLPRITFPEQGCTHFAPFHRRGCPRASAYR